ncbi:hypothetical protein EMIHUDRAFT_442977, partial [Emiliania huxleyi CCMP1516]|uniref:Protein DETOXIFICATION n=2 Tax=Emiliania huxleyi TaxID=2903 RepID=A0A0D3JXI7_EMIH1
MSVPANNDEPLVRIAEDDFAKAVSLRAILAASLPSIVNNAAQPIAAALQLGLLGHSDSAAQRVAVFSAVGAAVTFVANISNFVIVVTMSRVGHALGAKRWAALGRTVWTVLVCALVIGLLSALVLWLGRRPLLSALSLSRPPLDELAESYLPVALLRLPPLLLLRASSAVLVGYQRVKAASLLNLALACADTAAFYLLLHSSLVLAGGGLVAVGAAVAATCAIAAAAAVTAVLLLPPDAAVRVLPRRCCRRAAAAPEAEGALPADAPAAPSESSLLSLARDSLNVLVRSVLLSGSVLALMVAVAPLGAATVGAHAVVLQLWMVTSYVVDGFADVGTMVGSRLLGAGEERHMRRLTATLLLLGLATGGVAACLMAALHDPLVAAFTRDSETRAMLHTPLWTLLCALQPVNALVFVYDGLIYAVRAFGFLRNALLLGVCCTFAPALALAKSLSPSSLLAIWAAKAALNCWRCGSALLLIHVRHWPHWGGGRAQASAQADGPSREWLARHRHGAAPRAAAAAAAAGGAAIIWRPLPRSLWRVRAARPRGGRPRRWRGRRVGRRFAELFAESIGRRFAVLFV